MIIKFAMVALVAMTASAASLTFERGLPNSSNGGTDYVNPAAGSNGANVAWEEPGAGYIFGDDFGFTSDVVLTSVTAWMVTNDIDGTPASEFSDINLYLGPAEGTLTLVNVVPSTLRVYYQPDGENYIDAVLTEYAIFELTFDLSGLGLTVPANTLWGFALSGTPIGGNTFATHASNAALSVASGVTQQGADNAFRYYLQNGADYVYDAPLCDGACSGFASDLNVLVRAETVVPEPSTLLLSAAGFLALGLLRRRR